MDLEADDAASLRAELQQGIEESERAALEWATYQRELPGLLKLGYAEQFVAVFGDKIAKPAPTWKAAVERGEKEFRTRGVMLLQIGVAEVREVSIARLSHPC